MEISREKKLELLRTMARIRSFEERTSKLSMEGFVRGTVHFSTGMEAVAAGACLSVERTDYLTSTHRGHGHCIAKGVPLNRMMAEILGKETGSCSGRGGTMHIFDVACGVMGTIGVVGGGIPIATGLGLGIQQRKSDRVALSFMGDGATNQGAFHESLNLAAVWKLPVIYIIENNMVAGMTLLQEAVNIENLADRAGAYGMPGVVVDGNDVLAVFNAVSAAVARAREGKGPTLVECKTYRWHGHYTGDPCVYRSKDEVDAWKQKCPINRLKSEMIRDRLLTEAEYEQIIAEAEAAVDEAEAFAKASPAPRAETVSDHVLFQTAGI